MAFLKKEAGGQVIRDILEEAAHGQRELFCCWVNIAEVYYVIARREGAQRASDLLHEIEQLPIEILPADREISLHAAAIKFKYPIALGDAFAAGTALSLEAEVITGDPEFAQLEKLVPVVWLRNKK